MQKTKNSKKQQNSHHAEIMKKKGQGLAPKVLVLFCAVYLKENVTSENLINFMFEYDTGIKMV